MKIQTNNVHLGCCLREYLLEKTRKERKAIAKMSSTMSFSLNILTKIPTNWNALCEVNMFLEIKMERNI